MTLCLEKEQKPLVEWPTDRQQKSNKPSPGSSKEGIHNNFLSLTEYNAWTVWLVQASERFRYFETGRKLVVFPHCSDLLLGRQCISKGFTFYFKYLESNEGIISLTTCTFYFKERWENNWVTVCTGTINRNPSCSTAVELRHVISYVINIFYDVRLKIWRSTVLNLDLWL